MQTLGFRYTSILIAALLAGAVLYTVLGEPRGAGNPRWPSNDSVYAVDGWSAGPEYAEPGGFIGRTFQTDTGDTAMFSIFANQAPKLYGAGAEVPYLGNGYSVETPAVTAAASALGQGIEELIARRGSEQWLVFYAYGERRGLLGNGPRAWALALFDGMLGRENDYYKLYLTTRTDDWNGAVEREVGQLASRLFPRIAGFYAM
jgi:hypothetical protein